MARWRLTEDHYINASYGEEAIEWEYKEIDRITGRERRKRFPVPLFCNVDQIICRPGSERRDDNGRVGPIVFEGPPTPGMEPLDDEAREICAQYSAAWKHPIDSLPGQGLSASLLSNLERQLDALARNPATPVVASGVSKEEFEQLKEQMAQLMAQNAELQAEKVSGRRKVA
jgi:hypothetical protein